MLDVQYVDRIQKEDYFLESKKISSDQELIQSDPIKTKRT